MGPRLRPAFGVLSLCLAMMAQAPLVSADTADTANPRRLVISNSNTDWGLATPYLQARGGLGYMLTHFVFDNLVGQDRSGALAPELAREWELSDDGLSLDIRLNPEARWHDGTDITSSDVAFTFAYMAQHPHPFISLDNIRGTEILSPDTLRITLARPDAGVLSSVMVGMPILPEHIYRDQDNPRTFSEPRAMIGSGPYRLSSHERAKGRYVFSAVENYYGGVQKYDEVMIAKLQPEAAIQAAANGQVNVISDLPHRLVDYAKEHDLQVQTSPSGHAIKLRFDHSGPFAAVQRRQALAYLLDRDALAAIAYRGGARSASLGYLQDNSAWYAPDSVLRYPHDPDRAAALLRESGWTRDDDGAWQQDDTPVTLRLVTSGREEALAQVIKDQLEAFGLELSVRVMERGALRKQQPGKDYDLILAGGSTLGDPVTILERVFGTRWNNERYRDDGTLRQLAMAQAQSLDPDRRAALLAEFQQLYSRELPAIMLVNVNRTVAHDNGIEPWFFDEGLAIGIPVATHKYMLLED
ncbi:ABC transporter substrate-binding protein [Epibacterium sp. Ofav1-8]|uniref:ABC transporter substrate-binding protein n=1 Tax=Epibacterium sp. Ofav1-8 TaxID=2917735 RepID=UPI001EF48F2D|nr:ABC transporter substrate-binding protein [Epibacterium sp. Ofav1-8]MCG7625856.1 ABC transporter substrate-binding protein [Epibacterium sp. Ofav1-8]